MAETILKITLKGYNNPLHTAVLIRTESMIFTNDSENSYICIIDGTMQDVLKR